MMSPDERRMISDLFDRVREAERNPRDRDAEALIAQRAREAPNAAYTLAQVVLVQEQALGAAQRRIEELEDQLREAERAGPAPGQQGGFLGGLGSLFGGGQPAPSRYAPQGEPRAPGHGGGPWGREAQQPSRYAPQPGYGAAGPGMAREGMAREGMAQGGPWGGQAAAPARSGGGFLAGALGAAAGVAGGMLLANSIQGLFKSDPQLAQTAGQDASGLAAADLNNLPPLDPPGSDQGYASDGYQDASYDDGGYEDAGYDDGGSDV